MTPHASRLTRGSGRRGFTLIEMVVVVLVVLILLGLTVAVVGNVMGGDRVRGGARQIQNYLSGARDRAIYAASRIETGGSVPPAVGVRLLPDRAMSDLGATPPRIVYSSMVFVQEVDPLASRLTVYSETPSPGVVVWKASQFSEDSSGSTQSFEKSHGEFPLRAVGNLILRGLIPSRMEGPPAARVQTFYLPVYFDADTSKDPYYIRFTLANLRRDGSPNPPNPANYQTLASANWWLWDGELSKRFYNSSPSRLTPQMCRFRVLPSIMPSEEPRLLPQGCIIDGNSSTVGGSADQFQQMIRGDGSFDIMFNARGMVDGPLAAAGQVHLVVSDAEDYEKGFRMIYIPGPPANANGPGFAGAFVNADGTPYQSRSGTPLDTDGDGVPDERQGEEFVVSVRTQTGSVYTSEVNPTLNSASGSNVYLRSDPFFYADGGGEAR